MQGLLIARRPILFDLAQVSPTPGPRTGTGPWPVRNQATQQEVSIGRASEASLALPPEPCLLSPLPHPATVRGKIVFTKPVPGAKKVGDHRSSLFPGTQVIVPLRLIIIAMHYFTCALPLARQSAMDLPSALLLAVPGLRPASLRRG